jgi:hypothetical protein
VLAQSRPTTAPLQSIIGRSSASALLVSLAVRLHRRRGARTQTGPPSRLLLYRIPPIFPHDRRGTTRSALLVAAGRRAAARAVTTTGGGVRRRTCCVLLHARPRAPRARRPLRIRRSPALHQPLEAGLRLLVQAADRPPAVVVRVPRPQGSGAAVVVCQSGGIRAGPPRWRIWRALPAFAPSAVARCASAGHGGATARHEHSRAIAP